jgi:hypothetical protein
VPEYAARRRSTGIAMSKFFCQELRGFEGYPVGEPVEIPEEQAMDELSKNFNDPITWLKDGPVRLNQKKFWME